MAGQNSPMPLYVTCPYDINHRLAPRSYAAHIDKCARTSKKKLSICKYNSLHRIEPELLAHHYAEDCVDRPALYIDDWGTFQPTPAPRESNDVGALADALGAAAISDPPTESSTSASAVDDWTDDWNSGERHNFLAPEFNGAIDNIPTKSFTMNRILVQKLTKSQKKKFYEDQLNANLARIAKEKLEREVKEKQAEMERRRQQELVETAANEKAKLEREEKRKEIEQKKKEKKERVKAAKRAAYLAKTEQERNNLDPET